MPLRHPPRDLYRGGSLTGALEADHHIDRRRLRRDDERRGGLSHYLYQFFVDYREDELRRGYRLKDLLTRGARADRLYDVLYDLVIDVGLKQRAAHLAQSEIYVLFRELALTAQPREYIFKAFF